DDHLDHSLDVVHHPLLGTAKDPPASLEADRLPARLRLAGALDHLRELLFAQRRDGRDDLTGGGILYRDRVRRGSAVGVGGRLLGDARHGLSSYAIGGRFKRIGAPVFGRRFRDAPRRAPLPRRATRYAASSSIDSIFGG